MKTKEELNALKEKVETLNKRFAALAEDELAQVSGGKENWNPIENQTVPVKNGDYCPRCCSGFIVTAHNSNSGKAEYLICNLCEYQYTPPEWK